MKRMTSDSEPYTYLWDGVEVTTRPSQRTVELPSPDQPADD